MKIILAVGAPGADHEAVFDTLARAGVAAAQPSPRDAHTPQALSKLMLQALDSDPAKNPPLEQLRPGKVWQDLATDLAAANMDKPVWGWADHQLAWLMDFWQECDRQVRLLLVYTTPAEYLVHKFPVGSAPEPARVAAALREWQSWSTFLLRYHLRHPQVSVLVHASAAVREPQALCQLVEKTWGVTGLRAMQPAAAGTDEVQALLAQAARAFLPPGHEALSLEEQLHNTAQLAGADSADPMQHALTTWAAASALAVENGKLKERLAQAATDRADQFARSKKQLAEIEEAKLQTTQEAPSEELRLENELLVQQLHQVQAELERYFQESRKVQHDGGSVLAKFWRYHQPELLALDLRRPIFGDQWHAPEADGRWTGPAAISTVELPPLQAGEYLLEIEVVDAIAPGLLDTAEVELQGQRQRLAVEYLGGGATFPAICSAALAVNGEAEAPMELVLRLPRTASPAEFGSEDSRQLGIRVHQVRLIRQGDALHAQ